MRLDDVPITGQDFAISRWMSIVGKVLFLGGVVGVLFGKGGGVAPGLALMLGPVAILASYVSRLILPPGLGSVEVRGGDVVMRTKLFTQTLRARHVRSAYVVSRRLRGVVTPAVEIRSRRGNLHRIFVPDAAVARALVDAMGCGVGGKAVRLELGLPLRRLLHPLLAAVSTILAFLAVTFVLFVAKLVTGGMPGNLAIGLLFCVVTWLAYELAKRGIAPPVVTIGTDGMEVKRGFQTRRIPRDEIVRAGLERPDGPFVISRRGAKSVVVVGALLDRALIETAATEIERRLGTEEAHPRAASFERGARAVGEWKAGLRATLDAGYRAAGVTREDASAVLHSAGASAEQRVGAALALRVAGEPPERIRIAAEGAVDPQLRVAFEAIAEDAPEEELEKALRRLDGSEHRVSAR